MLINQSKRSVLGDITLNNNKATNSISTMSS